MKEDKARYEKNRKKPQTRRMNITKKLLMDGIKAHSRTLLRLGYEENYKRVEEFTKRIMPLNPQLVGGYIPWEEPNGIIGTYYQRYLVQGMLVYAANTPFGAFGGLKNLYEYFQYVSLSPPPWVLTDSGSYLLNIEPEYWTVIDGKISVPENRDGHYTITLERLYTGADSSGQDIRVVLDEGGVIVMPVEEHLTTIINNYLEVGDHEFYLSSDHMQLKELRIYRWTHTQEFK